MQQKVPGAPEIPDTEVLGGIFVELFNLSASENPRCSRKFQVLQTIPGTQVLDDHVRSALQAKCLRKFQVHQKTLGTQGLDEHVRRVL